MRKQAAPTDQAATTPADLVLSAAGSAKDMIARGQVALLQAAADWADLHRAPEDAVEPETGVMVLERRMFLAGPGAPGIEEFSTYELAAVLGWSTEATQALIGDALELRYRLPRLWELTLAGRVPVAVARDIATQTTDLCYDGARDADRLVCADPRHVGKVKARQLVREIRFWYDPDREVAEEESVLNDRGVWLYDGNHPAAVEMQMVLDRQEAQAFDHAVGQVAGALKRLGDRDSLDLRRAKAVGVLANPQMALDLLSGKLAQMGGSSGATEADSLESVRSRGRDAVMYLHLSDKSLLARKDGSGGPVSIERLGTLTQDRIREWLTGAKVTVRPVLDPTKIAPVDRHDPPEAMREWVVLRDGQCVFPGCTRDSGTADLDHIKSWRDPDTGGPPGQTSLTKLAPLCRRHHRAKTHGDFSYRRLPDGSYEWRLPTGIVRTVCTRQPPSGLSGRHESSPVYGHA